MLTSLSCADEWLTKEACVISYSDIFYESSAISLLQNSQAELAITYDKSWLDHWANRFEDPLSDAETFVLNESGNLADIGGKAKSVEEIEGQYMGLLRVTPASWTEIQQIRSRMNRKSRDDMHLTGMLREILFRGSVVIEALAYTGSWGEIDTTTDWEHYNRATDQS